jgi:hypothetical protein
MPRFAALAALLACALALSGCVKIEGQAEDQLADIGNVRVTTSVCSSGQDNDPNSDCKANGTNSDLEAVQNGDAQLLVAYRVPDAVIAPATITASYVAPASGSTTLAQNDSYASEMNQKAPNVPGEHWVGYMSPVITQNAQVQNARAQIVAEFGLRRGSDGAPFVGPFKYRVVTGVRGPGNTAADAARPVTCNDDVTKLTQNEVVYCVDSPKGSEAVFAADDRSIATRDLGVLDGPTATTAPGHAVSLPFTIRSVALNGSPVFNLSAGTTIPGGGASTGQSVFAPSGGDAAVPVSVGVPADTPPGDYAVTLSASTGSQLRTGHGTITVLGKPVLKLALGKKPKLGAALKHGLPVTVGCDGPCAIRVKLGSLGGGSGKLDAAGTTTVLAKFRRSVRRKRAHARRLAFRLAVNATGPGGSSTKTKRVTLRH